MSWPSFNYGAPTVTMETLFPFQRGAQENKMGYEVRKLVRYVECLQRKWVERDGIF